MLRVYCGLNIILSLIIYPGISTATFYERGNNLIYDDEQNITWFDFAYDPGFDDWDATEGWIHDLEYMGITFWRAPTLDELLYLGRNEFRKNGQYIANPFTNIGSGGEFYLSSSLCGNNQRWSYSLGQDRILQTWPGASIYGVAVMDGDTTPVPEPSSILLFGLGGFCLATRKYYCHQDVS